MIYKTYNGGFDSLNVIEKLLKFQLYQADLSLKQSETRSTENLKIQLKTLEEKTENETAKKE